MNVLVLFSYGSLETIDDVAAFYNDIFHGHATKEHMLAGVNQYETIGMADPLAGNTKRIGRAVTKRLRKATHEKWNVLIANHHSKPSIETVAKKCASMNLKRVVTFGLTPFHSITGNQAYEKKFNKIFRAEDNTTTLIHAPPYCENELFIEVLTDRVKTAQLWLPYTVRSDAEIFFTIHSMPGIAEVHQKMINQYASLAKKVADSLDIKAYHLAYRSGRRDQRWLEPDVLDVVTKLGNRKVPAVIFVEALSVIKNLEVLQEITRDAIEGARKLGIQAVQSEYLNDSSDFVDALVDHLLVELSL